MAHTLGDGAWGGRESQTERAAESGPESGQLWDLTGGFTVAMTNTPRSRGTRGKHVKAGMRTIKRNCEEEKGRNDSIQGTVKRRLEGLNRQEKEVADLKVWVDIRPAREETKGIKKTEQSPAGEGGPVQHSDTHVREAPDQERREGTIQINHR